LTCFLKSFWILYVDQIIVLHVLFEVDFLHNKRSLSDTRSKSFSFAIVATATQIILATLPLYSQNATWRSSTANTLSGLSGRDNMHKLIYDINRWLCICVINKNVISNLVAQRISRITFTRYTQYRNIGSQIIWTIVPLSTIFLLDFENVEFFCFSFDHIWVSFYGWIS
jgi:hypothetical protein